MSRPQTKPCVPESFLKGIDQQRSDVQNIPLSPTAVDQSTRLVSYTIKDKIQASLQSKSVHFHAI